jgi:hypothetical protein
MMVRMRRLLIAAISVALIASCAESSSSPAPTQPPPSTATAVTPSIGPGATTDPGASPDSSIEPTADASGAPIDRPDLRYGLVDQVGRPLFCDPDFYPVARDDEATLARSHLAAIRADAPTYEEISTHLGLDAAADPTPEQVLAIYREWKMLRALVLTDAGGGFSFDYVAADGKSTEKGFHVTGTIDLGGTIALNRRDPSGPPPCPICLARGTVIATPDSDRLVEDLRAGASVWTRDETGRRFAAVIVVTGSSPVPATHRVVDLVLSDGRSVRVSPGHPLADGRRVGDLRSGDLVDGATVVSAGLEAYRGGATFDLLPSGPTGTYWAGGIALASTLSK